MAGAISSLGAGKSGMEMRRREEQDGDAVSIKGYERRKTLAALSSFFPSLLTSQGKHKAKEPWTRAVLDQHISRRI